MKRREIGDRMQTRAETPPLRVRGRQRSREEMQHRGNRQQAVWDFVLPPGLENMNMENKIKNSIDAATVIGVEREVPNLPMDPVGEPDGIVAEAEGETTAQRSLIIGVTYHYTYEGSELLKSGSCSDAALKFTGAQSYRPTSAEYDDTYIRARY